MRVIKRYPNRKLYDTVAKAYVTLDGLAELIRSGEELQVVDNTTGEDLTTLTLTQIVVEQEKQRAGWLPQDLLTGMIRAGGGTLQSLVGNLGSKRDLLHQVDEEIERRLQALVNRGELAEEEARRLAEQLLRRGRTRGGQVSPSEEQIASALSRLGMPSAGELGRLSVLLDELAEQLDDLASDRGHS